MPTRHFPLYYFMSYAGVKRKSTIDRLIDIGNFAEDALRITRDLRDWDDDADNVCDGKLPKDVAR